MKKSAKRIGRPPSGDVARQSNLIVRVTEEEAAAYRAKCERDKLVLSEVIRRYLNRWVKK